LPRDRGAELIDDDVQCWAEFTTVPVIDVRTDPNPSITWNCIAPSTERVADP
jgi:hypothetical protein